MLRRTTRPTLIVPGDDDAQAGFGNLLVAVDLSPASKAVVDAAVRMVAGDAPRLTVVHAARGIEADAAVHSFARWTVPEYRTYVLDDARQALEAAVAGVPSAVATRVQLTTGSPAKAVVDYAEAVDADLVVVGRSGRFRPLGGALRDSTRALLIVPVDEALGASARAEQYQRAA